MKRDSIAYKVSSAIGWSLIHCTEWIIKRGVEQKPFFTEQDFPWVREIEAQCPVILEELGAILQQHPSRILDFGYASEENLHIIEPRKWKTFILIMLGQKVEQNCQRCPKTLAALQRIPGLNGAMFSVFEPGAHLLPHRGPFMGILRYHLGLIVPADKEACTLRIGEEVRYWEAGKSIIFDDTYEHEVWNRTTQQRVVLFVDFERPVPVWLRPVSRIMLWLIGHSAYAQNLRRDIDALEKQ